MAFNTAAALSAVTAKVQALPGLQRAYVGEPESFGNKVAAYVAVGGQRQASRTAGGYIRQEARFMVVFVYRVRGAEQDAETTLAGLVDALVRAFEGDKTLGGAVESCELDRSLADMPEYLDFAGQEYRRYPVAVVTTQSETIVST